MAFGKKRRRGGYSRGYPKQDDVFFDVEVLEDNRLEVRDMERDDYVLLKMPKTLSKFLTKKDNDIIGNIYRVKFEDILLETDMGINGVIAADAVVSKVAKKNLVKKVKRVYTPNGKFNETSDFQPSKGNFNIEEL